MLAVAIAGCATQEVKEPVKPAGEQTVTETIIKNISPEEAYELIQKNKGNSDFIILDVRTRQEFSQGHIDGAVNLDFYSKSFREELNKLDKTKTYLVYCRTGHRSGLAAEIMKELGFKNVYNMMGGIVEWQAKGFPIVS
jgi:rhodanese-related sulfurtransferase